jgi:acyl-CoA reductase-like NAD-dependent aldehyde dehydrogenase
MSEYTMTINGSAAETLATIDLVNPATGEVFAKAPDCSRAQLDHAMESAQKAFGPWNDDLSPMGSREGNRIVDEEQCDDVPTQLQGLRSQGSPAVSS